MVRIPRTSGRGARDIFAKLLNRVDPNAGHGFGFEGVFLRPGAHVEESTLWPSSNSPRVPILLECAGKTGVAQDGSKAWGHARSEVLYILWRYERLNGRWSELGRAQSTSWAWAVELGPLALRAITSQGTAVVLPSLEAVSSRISRFLAAELDPLESSDRGKVLAVLHDQFAFRISELAG